MTQTTPLSVEAIEGRIHVVRGRRVMLDADLAALYEVSTKALNQAVKRNRSRFPDDFAFQLTPAETVELKATVGSAPDAQGADTHGEEVNWSQFVTSSIHRGGTYLPWAFTEHGALMAANILRSARAVEMSLFVIRAFVKIREALASNAAVLKRLAEIDQTLLVHDTALRDVYQKLLPLLSPPAEIPRPKIGFHPATAQGPASG